MTELIGAAVLFLAIHILSSTPLRAGVVHIVGEKVYLALFSLLSVSAIVWLVRAYNHAPAGEVLWVSGDWARWIALLLVFIAVLLVFLGLTVRNPGAVGFERALETAVPAQGILRVTRHPFLWGVGLWAVAHLLNNGDMASVLFFATFAILALVGTVLVDAKKRARYGTAWENFAMTTSNVPFAAIAQGRNRFNLKEIGWWRVVLAMLLFVGLLHGHVALFGAAPLPA